MYFAVKRYTVNQFDEKFSQWGKFLKPHSSGNVIAATILAQKFRQISFLLKRALL